MLGLAGKLIRGALKHPFWTAAAVGTADQMALDGAGRKKLTAGAGNILTEQAQKHFGLGKLKDRLKLGQLKQDEIAGIIGIMAVTGMMSSGGEQSSALWTMGKMVLAGCIGLLFKDSVGQAVGWIKNQLSGIFKNSAEGAETEQVPVQKLEHTPAFTPR
ncbi:MAG: hypothetical protein H6868_04965 [Rhodospirillales bacterium]|nr:hypothetical protein [Rhodospirillales bacterium]